MKTIIAAFCDAATAEQGAQFLRQKLASNRDASTRVDLIDHQQGTDTLGVLAPYHLPAERSHRYAEVMRRGATLLVAHVPDGEATALAHQLDQMGSLDLDASESRWRKEGWNGYDASSPAYDASSGTSERMAWKQETADRDLDVVEEHVSVGKREVDRGGVRVRTFVVETPVDTSVQLREEHIQVQREAVDERISAGAADASFTEDEFVVTAKGEEAVVGKEARIVERVHVGKTAETRTEEIHETERRKDVEVEQIAASNITGRQPRIVEDETIGRPHRR